MSQGNGRIITPNSERFKAVSALEARKIAESVGQLVYDKFAEEHDKVTQQMIADFNREIMQTREVLSTKIAELRRRSPMYVLWIAWNVDKQRFRRWLEGVLMHLAAFLDLYFDIEFGNPPVPVDEILPQPDETAEKGGKVITEELPEPVVEEGHGQPTLQFASESAKEKFVKSLEEQEAGVRGALAAREGCAQIVPKGVLCAECGLLHFEPPESLAARLNAREATDNSADIVGLLDEPADAVEEEELNRATDEGMPDYRLH